MSHRRTGRETRVVPPVHVQRWCAVERKLLLDGAVLCVPHDGRLVDTPTQDVGPRLVPLEREYRALEEEEEEKEEGGEEDQPLSSSARLAGCKSDGRRTSSSTSGGLSCRTTQCATSRKPTTR